VPQKRPDVELRTDVTLSNFTSVPLTFNTPKRRDLSAKALEKIQMYLQVER